MSGKRKFILPTDKDLDEKPDTITDGSVFRKHILEKKVDSDTKRIEDAGCSSPLESEPNSITVKTFNREKNCVPTSLLSAAPRREIIIPLENKEEIKNVEQKKSVTLTSQIDAEPGPSSASDTADIQPPTAPAAGVKQNLVGKTFAETFAFLKDKEYYKEVDQHHKEAKEAGKDLGKTSTDSVPGAKIKSNSIIVNIRQRGNPILKHIRNVPWEFGDIIPDYALGQTTCALFLRYHQFNPEYIHDRLKQLGSRFELRVLLVQVDVKDPHHSLKELAKICIFADCTLILAWSPEEAGRYLETYKCYENKPPDILQEKVEGDYLSKLTDCLTSVKSVNKTDVITLLSTFGSFESIVSASKEEMALCPGIGPQKIFKSEFLIQDLISRLIVDENEISIYQNLSLGIDNQKQLKFRK